MSKFVLKAYNHFIRGIEVSSLTITHFLLRQLSIYLLKSNSSIIINFYQVKTNIQRVFNSLLVKSTNKATTESIDYYINFNRYTYYILIYKNYKYQGTRLTYFYFYKYTSQIFIQTFKSTQNQVFLFLFNNSYLLYTTYIQVSISSLKLLKTLSLYSSFTSISEQDTNTLDTILQTQDKIYKVLLSLFYLQNRLWLL